MVLNWIDHPSYRRDEQLMHVLFECGMATFEQLKGITGWTERSVKRQIKNLQKRAKDSQHAGKPGDDLRKEEQWIISHRLSRPYGKSQVVYTLGRPSLHYVHEMRQEENKKIKDPPFGQAMHFIGINEILVRSLREFGREQVSWLSTQQVTDLFLLSQQDSTLDRRNMIRPDARLSIGAVHYYIEFDNDTEMPRQLERKFHRYVQTLNAIRDQSTPVLWITTNPKRKDYLKRNWEAIKRKYYAAQSVPDMHFFVQSDEIATIREHSIRRD